MEYKVRLQDFAPALTDAEVSAELARIKELAVRNYRKEVYAFALSAVDLTTLTCNDSVASVSAFAQRAVDFYTKYPELENVASICVYPSFVETVGLAVDGSPMRITSVAAGFPASQTFLEVKMLEVAMAIENGADEIDIVMNVGKVLEGEYDEAANEVEVIKSEMGNDTILKVILETGALKTSTGKIDVAATPEAAVVMCRAIKLFHEKTGVKVGFKAAGGVRTPEDAALYYTIVEEILGEEWLTTDLFRIGASSAANNLLSGILGKEVKHF